MGIYMRLFRRNKTAVKQQSSNIMSHIFPANSVRPPVRGTREFLALWRQSPWIRAVVSKIAFSVSMTEWQAYNVSSTDKKFIQNHPILDLLSRGGGNNSYSLNGRSCIELTQKHLELTGEAFWVLERNGLGVPVGFVPLAPHWVQDIARPNSENYKIMIPNGGWVGTIPAEDIIYFKDVDPMNPYDRGASAVEALADEINTDEFAAQHISSFLANRARPDIVISGEKDAPIPAEAATRLENTWQNKFGGSNQQGKPFVSTGAIKITPITHDFSQLQLKDIRTFERDLIVSVFGIPPEKIGILVSSNKATIDAADMFFAKDTLEPRLILIRETLNNQLCSKFDEKLRLDFTSHIQQDKDFILKVMATAPYAFTQEDWRKLCGFSVPEDDSQKLYFVPYNLMIRDSLKPDTAAEKLAKENTKLIVKGERSNFSLSEITSISEEHEQPQVRADISRLIESVRQEILLAFAKDVLEDIDDRLALQVTSRMSSFIFETTAEKITKVDDTTKKKVKDVLLKINDTDFSKEDILSGVAEVFDSVSRARTIAQTESTQIAGFAAKEAIQQSGVKKMEWLTTRDGAERSSHAEMDGQVVSIGEEFVSGDGNTTTAPGDFGIAEEDINCRCAITAVFEDNERSIEAKDMIWRKMDRSRQIQENKYFTIQREVFKMQKELVLAKIERMF